MIGIQRGRLADWLNNNTDILIITCGALILATVESTGIHSATPQRLDYGFWGALIGVILVSTGVSATVCYRILLKRHHNFNN